MPLTSGGSLIGRDRELEQLRGLVRAVRDGAAMTVSIEGETGIGKTRLLASLLDAAREQHVAVFHGVAPPLEHTRPFGPLIDALDLRPGSSDPRRAAIGRLLTGQDAPPPGSGPAAGQLQFRAVEDMIDLIELLTDQGPVLLALEVLHWGDSSTLLAVATQCESGHGVVPCPWSVLPRAAARAEAATSKSRLPSSSATAWSSASPGCFDGTTCRLGEGWFSAPPRRWDPVVA